jgi:hypothetical protein
VPKKVKEELKSGNKRQSDVSYDNFIKAVKKSAIAVVQNMTRRGYPVDYVTTGYGYNDLAISLQKVFGNPKDSGLAEHRGYIGYSDAKVRQFVLMNVQKENSLSINNHEQDNCCDNVYG